MLFSSGEFQYYLNQLETIKGVIPEPVTLLKASAATLLSIGLIYLG